ncbi:DUF2345 domain-containing protein [Thiomonas bhubaneswarensis]|uniref:DUF2345 domain-containing protein n=1 Tax=Thiomonas bhubaneswarensis TaxID=339866 RepID=UPI0011474229
MLTTGSAGGCPSATPTAGASVDVALADVLRWRSQRDTSLASTNADIDFAAARRIVIAVSADASITLAGAINAKFPRQITVPAGAKSFSGPTSLSRESARLAGCVAKHSGVRPQRPPLLFSSALDRAG